MFPAESEKTNPDLEQTVSLSHTRKGEGFLLSLFYQQIPWIGAVLPARSVSVMEGGG